YTQPGDDTDTDAEAEAVDLEALDLEALDDTELIAHIDRLMSELESGALRRVEHSRLALKTARDELQRLQQQQEQLREAGEYRRRRTVHEQQAPSVRQAKLELEHHGRAQAVVEAQRHSEAAHSALSDAVNSLQQRCDAAQQYTLIISWTGQQQIFTFDPTDVQPLIDGWKTAEAAAIRALEQVTQHEKTHAAIQTGQQQLATRRSSQQNLTERIG